MNDLSGSALVRWYSYFFPDKRHWFAGGKIAKFVLDIDTSLYLNFLISNQEL